MAGVQTWSRRNRVTILVGRVIHWQTGLANRSHMVSIKQAVRINAGKSLSQGTENKLVTRQGNIYAARRQVKETQVIHIRGEVITQKEVKTTNMKQKGIK